MVYFYFNLMLFIYLFTSFYKESYSKNKKVEIGVNGKAVKLNNNGTQDNGIKYRNGGDKENGIKYKNRGGKKIVT